MDKQGVGQRLHRRLTGRVAKLSIVAGIAILWIFTPWTLAALAGSAIRNGIAALTLLTRIPDAITVVGQERERTAAEREAFERFARRAMALELTESQLSRGADRRPGTTLHQGPAVIDSQVANHPSAPIEEIRDTYRETVMAVPHYEEEYDESLEEHIAQEFGTEIGIAVSQSETVTPQLRDALVSASIEARDERADLLRRLDEERQSLQDASTSLEEIHEAVRTVEESLSRRADRELADAWDRLEELEGECRTLLRERQCRIDRDESDRALWLQEYLYASQEWTYPVLSDALGGIDRIQEAKRRVVGAILHRG